MSRSSLRLLEPAAEPTPKLVAPPVAGHADLVDWTANAFDEEAAYLKVLTEAVETLGRGIGASRAFYCEVKDEGRITDVVMDWTDGVPSLRGPYPNDMESKGVQQMLRDGVSVVEDLDQLDDDPINVERHRSNRNLAWIAVPLVRGGRFVAVVGVSQDRPRRYTPADVALVRETGERTWTALAQAGTLRRLRESQMGMEARGAHERFFRTVTDAVREDRDDTVILFKVVAMLAAHLGVTGASINEVDPADPLLHHVYYHAAGGPNDGIVRPVRMPAASAIYMRIIENGAPLVVRDVVDESDPSLAEFLRSWNCGGAISVPIVHHGRLAMILGVQSAVPRDWSAPDVRLACDLADLAWTAVRRVRAEAALAERERTQALLIGWNDAVREAANADAVIEETLARLEDALGHFAVTYSELDATGTLLTHVRVRRNGVVRVEPESFPMVSIGPAEPLARFDDEATIAIDDVTTDPRLPADAQAIYARYDVGAVLVAPIVDGGRAVALLAAQDPGPVRWTKGQRQLLRDLADRVWAAIVRVRAETALAERETNQAFLIDWSDAVRDETDPERVIVETVTRLGESFDLCDVSFSELDQTGTLLENVHVWRRGETFRDTRALPISVIGPGLVAEFLNKASVSIDDVFNDPRIAPDCHALYREHGIGALLGAPIVSHDRVVALLAMHADRPRAWTASERQVLRDLADRVWSSVERTRAEIALTRSRAVLGQAEKMASLGSVLAGISHELNNPLAVVTAQAQLIAHLAEGTDLAARATQVHEAGDRCARIIQTFLAMARQTPPERRTVPLADIVSRAMQQVSAAASETGIAMLLQIGEALPEVLVDPDQVHQIVVNLLVNAQHAILDHSGSERRVTVRAGQEGDRLAFLDVTDGGPGVPDAMRARIFEPFFTTKPAGRGTGMGLALAQGLAELHGGTLTLVPSTTGGASFRLTLPLATA